MRRRDFITLLGSAAAAWPIAARAQEPMRVIGYLSSQSPDDQGGRLAGFRQGLKEAGYVEGQNVTIEYRWARNQYDRLFGLANELVDRKVAVIVASANAAALAAKAATAKIPIVFSVGFDPVQLDLASSLRRPGANVTGVSNLNTQIGPKRLELLHELIPTAADLAALLNPTNASHQTQSRDLEAAARTMGIRLRILQAVGDRDLDTVFASLGQLRTSGLMVGADAFLSSRSEQLAALTVRYAMPAIHEDREFAAAGGLMSYGTSFTDMYRQVGIYTGRILKGEKAADLPVQQSTKVDLIINLKTAKTLGISVPLSLLGRADEVIE